MQTKKYLSFLAWTLLLLKVEKNSKRSGIQFVRWYLSFYLKMILYTLMNINRIFLMNPISKEYGNTIGSILLRLDLQHLWTKGILMNKMPVSLGILLD